MSPFFATLRKSKDFEWTPTNKEALQQLKKYFIYSPLLSKPKDGEQLFIYLVVFKVVMSIVFIWKEDSKRLLVYYVSKSLLDTKTCYTKLEKLVLALITASCKLRPYFQCHPIIVLTTYPLKSILYKPKLFGHLTKWTVDLSKYDLTFQHRTALKSQVLDDYIT